MNSKEYGVLILFWNKGIFEICLNKWVCIGLSVFYVYIRIKVDLGCFIIILEIRFCF